MAKYWAQLELLAGYLLPGKPKGNQIWRRVFRTKSGKKIMKSLEASLRRMPDESFEAAMTELDSMIEMSRKGFASGLAHLPKRRGGRHGAFSLDIRRRAVQDIGHEYPRCDSLREAIEVVAARNGMTPEYLHKVWKNRKRLRQREV